MLYHYRAIDEQRHIAQGQLYAINPADLELRLGRMGLTLIRAKLGRSKRLGPSKVRRRNLITFCFHM